MVGNPSTLYLASSSSLAFFNSGLSFLVCGKSTSTSTRCFLAYSANSGFENTSLCNLMHQPHQSEPVKSSMTSFFSSLAWATALGTSVSQVSSSALTRERARPANNTIMIFFIVVCVLSCRGLDAGKLGLFTSYGPAANNCRDRLALQRPPVEGTVLRLAPRGGFVKYP